MQVHWRKKNTRSDGKKWCGWETAIDFLLALGCERKKENIHAEIPALDERFSYYSTL